MKDVSLLSHHPAIEELTDVLCNKTQNTDRPFFRVMIAYFLAKMASSMRATVITKDRGSIPVNLYALSLAVSGSGKGHSVGILENDIIKGFRDRFMNDTFPLIAEINLKNLADQRALRKTDGDPDREFEDIKDEFRRLGGLAFTFDSGTGPAVKQMRHKLLMANIGSINLQIDEIGSNMLGAIEVLNVFLELYDQGIVKQKLTKSTKESERGEELDGKTPTNMLLFGTPAKLLDGSKTEDEFYSMLETGYARRCIFAFGHRQRAADSLTPEEIYNRLIDHSYQASLDKWATHFTLLGDPAKFNWQMMVPDDVAIELLTYKIACERFADTLPDHEEIKKAEVSHRYFKALKLAGIFAFIDEASEVTMDNLYQAIKLVEESGQSFERIFSREKNYVKLAKFLSTSHTEQTHADLNESLPFFKGSQAARNELLTLAMAWGYRNHIIIKKTFEQGIEFFKGETLKGVNLEKLRVSYGDHVAYNYLSEDVSFENLHVLTQQPDMHWINHHLVNGSEGRGHRAEDNVIPGFDMVVIDVDKGTSVQQVMELMKDYKYLIYTTKRHTDEEHRFRLVLPMNYRLSLDAEDYKEFMTNVFSWLPFEVDLQTNQRARKWLTHPGQYHYHDGELLDVLPFIPKTSRNEDFKNSVVKLENLDNLERWFALRMVNGNRNNQMLRFAMMLVDSGFTYQDIERRVLEFNAKLDNKLPEDELRNSVLITVAKKLSNPKHP